MSQRRFVRLPGRVLLVALLPLMVAGLGFAVSTDSWSGTDQERQEWVDGLALVTTGHFDQGAKLIGKLANAGLNDPRIQRVYQWLGTFQQMEAERASRRQADYKQYAEWVQQDLDSKKWMLGITTCALAFETSQDQGVFRGEPWVQNAVGHALGAAKEYEKEHEWYKAGRIYAYLERMFPHEPSYRASSERVQDHLTLKLTYTEDSDWETAVSNITPLMAIQAFKRMEVSYLRPVSLKSCTLAALQRMLYLTEEPSLAEVFKSLDNEGDVDEFAARIRSLQFRTREQEDETLDRMVETFDQVLGINKELDLFPQEVVIREFVQGAMGPLDEFSDMLWPAETEEFNKHTQGKFTGVGISIRKGRGEPILVISPLEDTPAYAAGIRPGDMITKIDGKPAAPITITTAVRMITGPPNTKVTLTIKRPGVPQEFDKTLTRAEITIHTIKGYQRTETGHWDYMIDPDLRIAYVRMTNFSEETAAELADTLKQLKSEERIRGLILDLRGNPGGLLKTAVEVASLFLPGEKEIVSTRDRAGEDFQVFTAEPEGEHHLALPMVVLVNGGSASASEIVSGALQVHKRALVVGERTFGKGSVQQVLPVTPSRTAFLKLTTARYYLPNGRCLHRDADSVTWGVDPDIQIKLAPKEFDKVVSMRMKRDILKGLNQEDLTEKDLESVLFSSSGPADEDKEQAKSDQPTTSPSDDTDEDEKTIHDDPNNYPEIDPQLDAGLLLMRVHLETNHPWLHGEPELAARQAVGKTTP